MTPEPPASDEPAAPIPRVERRSTLDVSPSRDISGDSPSTVEAVQTVDSPSDWRRILLPFTILIVAAILAGVAVVMILGRSSHRRRVVTVIRPGVGSARTSTTVSNARPQPSTTLVTSTVTTTTRAEQPTPTVSQCGVDASGAVGTLRFNTATESDVVRIWGQPQFQGQTTPPASGYSVGTILGYGCGSENRRDNTPGLIDVGPSTHGRVGCGDLFYLNSVTGRLVGFQSADARVHTTHGTSPGMPQAEANRREGVTATIGCIGGIGETSAAAALELDNRGGVPDTGGVNLTTGVVAIISLEAKRNAVGIQFC